MSCAAPTSGIGADNPLRYRGYYYDTELKLYYLQSRYYDPETGRFISADSLLVAGDSINGTNMFAYCLNNPVMLVDPSGDSPMEGVLDPANLEAMQVSLKMLSDTFGLTIPQIAVLLAAISIAIDIYTYFSTKETASSNTRYLDDVKAEKQYGKHYKLAWVENGELVTYGSGMTFVEALA